MQFRNSSRRYGAITKTFHWLTALLILSAIPLGYVANDLAYAIKDPNIATTEAELARTVLLFSLHKTIGVAAFFVAIARIAWALSQPKPGLLNGDKPLEAFAAELVHWMLYVSLVMAPLTGWIHHAATTGFAPIWWPFGQSLPFVPKDEPVAELFASLHLVFVWTMIASLGLHIAGALKHHVIDKDATLRRMLPGATEARPSKRQPGHGVAFVGAAGVWAVILTGGALAGLYSHDALYKTGTERKAETAVPAVQQQPNGWTVTDGTLGLSVLQAGSQIDGQFNDWSATIAFDETAQPDGTYGRVTVEVAIPSLTLGSVTAQAKAPDYLSADAYPTATFDAVILKSDTGYSADGTLRLKDAEVPLSLPFDLTLRDDTANASGRVEVDRRDFGIGGADEGTVGASVTIAFNLSAKRQTGDTADPIETAALAPNSEVTSDADTSLEHTTQTPDQAGSIWDVTDGALGIDVNQLGSNIRGQFETWSAEITYDDTSQAEDAGEVRVEIPINALRLGSVTAQAMGPDYFDASQHPLALFTGKIQRSGDDHTVVGELTVKGVTLPLTLPFDLQIDADTATAKGKISVDRRDFGVGGAEETNVGALVGIDFQLTAQRK